jgi:ferredoxin-NADP reductase
MSVVFSPGVVQFAGAVIVCGVLIQVAILLASSVRRLGYEREQRRHGLEALRYQVEVLLAQSHEEWERIEASWNGFRKFEILRKEQEIEGAHSFYLIPHDGKPLPPFMPGQYLTFQLKIPNQPKPVIRCYSLSDSPGHWDHYRVSIKKVPPPRDKPDAPPGLSSSYFNDELRVGDILDVKAPSGHFFLDTTVQTPVVLIGGGIGITPVLSMLNTICESGSKRETWFFLGIRNGDEHMMKEHLHRLDREHENVHLMVCYSDPLENDVEGGDYQHAGWVGVDLFKRVLPSNNFEFYICGPPPMMESLTSGLGEWGVPERHVHFEAFGPATVKKAKTEEPPATDASAMDVVFERSGKTLKWDASFDNLLDFAEGHGIDIDSGCRAGNCGTCITAVKSGDVTYTIDHGAEPETGSCLTCVSVPKSNLSLDA